MSMVWLLLISLWRYLPWVAIGLMAGMALRKNRDSRALMMQAGAAVAMFLLGAAQWVIVDFILHGFGASVGVQNAANIIFEFLLFVALVIFAVGYCAERFTRRRNAIQVSATPAD